MWEILMVSHCILISNVLPPLSWLEMRTSSGQKSPNLRQQKSPNLNLATGFMKNVKQWKGLRWGEGEYSPRGGPCKLSQRPRALWEGSLHLRPFHCLYHTKTADPSRLPLKQDKINGMLCHCHTAKQIIICKYNTEIQFSLHGISLNIVSIFWNTKKLRNAYCRKAGSDFIFLQKSSILTIEHFLMGPLWSFNR